MNFLLGIIIGIVIGVFSFRYSPIKVQNYHNCPNLICPACEQPRDLVKNILLCQEVISKYIDKLEKCEEGGIYLGNQVLNIKNELDNCRMNQVGCD